MLALSETLEGTLSTEQANLGLATTKEMLQELEARFTVSRNMHYAARIWFLLNTLEPELLDYRTVDS